MKIMTKLLAFCAVCGISSLLCAKEYPIMDFKTLNPKAWHSFRGAKIAKTAQGAMITQPGMISSNVRVPLSRIQRREWIKKYNGIAFRIKGNGSTDYGTIALQLQSNTFMWYFPLKNKNWVEYRVHFKDLSVYNGGAASILPGPGNITINALDKVRFGDRWTITHNNARRQKMTYEVSDIRLISNAKVRLETGKYKAASFDALKKKLRSGKKVSILCLGDSITAGSAVRNADKNRYASQVNHLLQNKYKKKNASCYSLAVGGANSYDVSCWVYRDFEKIPDLVSLMIGYNDRTNGLHKEAYRDLLELWIKRVAAKTKGKSAILLITPIPGRYGRYLSQDGYAQVVRETAKKYSLPCLDMNKIFKAIPQDQFDSYFADGAHPNVKGHTLYAQKYAEFLMK